MSSNFLKWLTVLIFAYNTCCSAANSPAQTNSAVSDHEASVRAFNSWKVPQPPRHIIGNIYYVGSAGVSSWLITTPRGHILIDTTFEDCVPQICTNIEQLGYRVGDIKFILNSHTHVDHAGGDAAMKRRTGAQIIASAADAHLLATGERMISVPFRKTSWLIRR